MSGCKSDPNAQELRLIEIGRLMEELPHGTNVEREIDGWIVYNAISNPYTAQGNLLTALRDFKGQSNE